MKKTLIAIIAFLGALAAAGQTPGFVKADNVTVNTAEMESQKELLKQLKKKYGFNSARIENWIDGNTYIVAKKKYKYSLFALDGHPMLTHGGEVQWFSGILPRIIDGQPFFILYDMMSDTSNRGITNADTIITLPQRWLKDFEMTSYGGKTYLKGYTDVNNKSAWPRFGYLFSIDGHEIFNYSLKLQRLTFDDYDGGRFFLGYIKSRYIPKLSSYEITHIKDAKGNLLDSVECRYNNFVNHYGFGTNWGSGASVDEFMGNKTISVGYDTKLNSLISPEGKIVLDSISEATYYPATNQFTYKKIVGDDILTGLYDPAKPEANIPPMYSEVDIDADGNVLIRPTLLAVQEMYVPGKEYPRNFSCEAERLLEKVSTDSLFNAYKDKPYAEFTPEELICYSRGVLRLYKSFMFNQNLVLDHYSTPNPQILYSMKPANEQRSSLRE